MASDTPTPLTDEALRTGTSYTVAELSKRLERHCAELELELQALIYDSQSSSVTRRKNTTGRTVADFVDAQKSMPPDLQQSANEFCRGQNAAPQEAQADANRLGQRDHPESVGSAGAAPLVLPEEPKKQVVLVHELWGISETFVPKVYADALRAVAKEAIDDYNRILNVNGELTYRAEAAEASLAVTTGMLQAARERAAAAEAQVAAAKRDNAKLLRDLAGYSDTEADGIVFCGKCGAERSESK